MAGTHKSGNTTDRRGKPPRIRRRITRDAALALRLVSWLHYGRPATDEEEDAYLVSLILAAKEQRHAE